MMWEEGIRGIQKGTGLSHARATYVEMTSGGEGGAGLDVEEL